MSESEKDEKGMIPKEKMKATGKKTGKIAKLSFQAGGKHHEKGEEILGVDEKVMKELESKGLVE